jgi:NADH-quinone oxidoreductase subunit J
MCTMTLLAHISFWLLAAITIVGTASAMSLRNPIHCILGLSAGLVGLAALFLQLGAQFIGFTQVLVYVGAVAILAVFAIMMTQSAADQAAAGRRPLLTVASVSGALVAVAVFGVLARAVISMKPAGTTATQPAMTVNQVGDALMHGFVLPLEIMGVLLTAALIGAVIVAMPERREKL